MTARWWWVLGLMGLLTACETKKPPGPRGLLGPDGTPLGPAPARPATNATSEYPRSAEPSDPFFEPSGARAFDTSSAAPSDAPSAPPPPAPVPGPSGGARPGINTTTDLLGASAPTGGRAPATRDLSQELVTLLGSPAPCLDLGQVADRGGRLELVLNAMVMPSGRVTRAEVRAPHQPPEAVECLKERLLAGSLAPDVPGAPVSVQATVPVEVVAQSPRPTGTPPGPPDGTSVPTSTDEVAQPDGTELAQPSE